MCFGSEYHGLPTCRLTGSVLMIAMKIIFLILLFPVLFILGSLVTVVYIYVLILSIDELEVTINKINDFTDVKDKFVVLSNSMYERTIALKLDHDSKGKLVELVTAFVEELKLGDTHLIEGGGGHYTLLKGDRFILQRNAYIDISKAISDLKVNVQVYVWFKDLKTFVSFFTLTTIMSVVVAAKYYSFMFTTLRSIGL